MLECFSVVPRQNGSRCGCLWLCSSVRHRGQAFLRIVVQAQPQTMASVQQTRALYRAFLREGRSAPPVSHHLSILTHPSTAAKFPNYNVRECVYCLINTTNPLTMCCRYIRRKVREDFRAPAAGDDLQQRALDQLAMVKRQATIYSLYARSVPNVMVRIGHPLCSEAHSARHRSSSDSFYH